MDYKIIWSDSALFDLKEICDYIAARDPQASYKLGRDILDHVRILESFPYIGPHYPRDGSGATREILVRKYRVFYQVSEEPRSVEILYVWHGAREEPPFSR
jgi:toxin ParE1/3/4